jgi:hypothetical protein
MNVSAPHPGLRLIASPHSAQSAMRGKSVRLTDGSSRRPPTIASSTPPKIRSAQIGRRGLKEHADGMRELDHVEPPALVFAPATTRMMRQAGRASAVGMRSRIALGRSASMGGDGWSV